MQTREWKLEWRLVKDQSQLVKIPVCTHKTTTYRGMWLAKHNDFMAKETTNAYRCVCKSGV